MQALRVTVEVRVWQWILNWMVMLTLVFGGIYGLARYSNDQRAASDRAAAIAKFENDRDSHTQCLLRADSRDDLRGVLLSIVTEFSEGRQEVIDRASAVIEAGYPRLNKEDCGPAPKYPFPPPGEGG